uniref:Uncharacterized protein n=1 Tax=Arundo donax TaxID=35708 RepID=A0A0A9G4M3_ARUDO
MKAEIHRRKTQTAQHQIIRNKITGDEVVRNEGAAMK